MIGDKIREARLAQQLSLTQVASKAKISVATLSRIETNKQRLELNLFLAISKILNIAPQDLLGSTEHSEGNIDPIAAKIASLAASERVQFWKNLSALRRERSIPRRLQIRNMGQQVEELLAQVDFLREEIDTFRKKLRRRPRRASI